MNDPRASVVLIGPMGAGKSTVGRLLADALGLPFRDTDEQVEATAGKSVSDVFVDDGEDAFRLLERAAVASAVSGLEDEPAVLSLGGGAVLDAGTQDLLAALDPARALVVFLDVGVADAARRVGLNANRPLLMGNPRAQWIALMDRRRPTYERLAAARVPTDGLAPEEVAAQVLAARERTDGG
jgi:shikimate kinase